MPVVKTVSPGQPITAGWANTLVHEVNSFSGVRSIGKAANSTSLRAVKMDNDAAWQISRHWGIYTINAGQIYFNGHLVTPKAVEEGETAQQAEETTTSNNSYNQFCSAKNWDKNYKYTSSGKGDFPIWYLSITAPKIVNASNVGEVEAELMVMKSGSEIPKIEESELKELEEKGKQKLNIQLNKVEGDSIVQLVSGSIHLSSGSTLSFMNGDGILVDYPDTTNTNVVKLSLYVSFIADDGIEITESWLPEDKESESEEQQPTTQAEGETESSEETEKDKPAPTRMKVIRIKNTSTPLSFIGIDGITVTESMHHEDISTEEDETNIWKDTKVITISGVSHVGKDGITISEEEYTETLVTNEETGEEKTITKKVLVFSGSANLSFIGTDGIGLTDEEIEFQPEGDLEKKKVRLITISDLHSFIGIDGIKVTEEITTKETETDDPNLKESKQVRLITIGGELNGISFIGEDGITVTEEEKEEQVGEGETATTKKVKVVTIIGTNNEYSFIGEDGVFVNVEEKEETGEDGSIKKVNEVKISHDSTEIIIEGANGTTVTTSETQTPTQSGATKKTKTFTITGNDVEVQAGENVTVSSSTSAGKKTYTVSANKLDLEEGDGIEITQTGNKYKISCNLSKIEYDFDSSWFIVTGNSVTLNEAKLDAVATSLAPSVSSQIVSTTSAALDTYTDTHRGVSGSIMAEVTTQSGESATARVWTA